MANIIPNVKTGGQTPRLLVTHERVNAATHLIHRWGACGIFKTSGGNILGIVVRTDWTSRNTCKVWSPDTDQVYFPSTTNFVPIQPDVGLIARINAIAAKKAVPQGEFLVAADGSPMAALQGGTPWVAPNETADADTEEFLPPDNGEAVDDVEAQGSLETVEAHGSLETANTENAEGTDPARDNADPPASLNNPTEIEGVAQTPVRVREQSQVEVEAAQVPHAAASAAPAAESPKTAQASKETKHRDHKGFAGAGSYWDTPAEGGRRSRGVNFASAAVHLALSSSVEFSKASDKVKAEAVAHRRAEVFACTEEDTFSKASPEIQAVVLNIALGKLMKTEKGTASAMKEVKQMLDLSVFKPRHHQSLTEVELQNLINIMIFGKEKRNGDLKARGVGIGSSQDRHLYEQKDVSSPTASSQTVFIQVGVGSYEKRKVHTMDVPGAYLHAVMPKGEGRPTVIVRINPVIAKMMLILDPSLEKYVHKDACIYMEVMKALYGLIESAYLWYKTFCADLTALGFKRSEYDLCFFYDEEKGTHISLHVDDSLITTLPSQPKHHIEIREYMKKRYGGITMHSMEEEGEVDFLGMRITRTSDGAIRIDQEKYITDMCKKFGVTTESDSPASENLFEVDDESPPSSDPRRFVSAVMTVMYASLRTKPETLVVTTWLSSRCQSPTRQDDKKLLKLLSYCNKYAVLGKRMKPKSLQLYAYADASHGVHPDCKGHAGAVIGLGGAGNSIFTQSSKIKLQGRSSAEDELYGVDKVLSVLQHATNFMEEIGYPQKAVPLGQDNKSTITMCEKGHSNDGRARHIKARYFYVKFLIDAGVLEVFYVPTLDMVADIFTKPLSGALFRKFRRAILGEYPSEEESERVSRKVSERMLKE